MYKIRVTTTVEQIDFDGRVLFSATDTADESSIEEARNRVNVRLAFGRALDTLNDRIGAVLRERYESRPR